MLAAVLSVISPLAVLPATEVVATLPIADVATPLLDIDGLAAPANLKTVISNLRDWLVGLLATVATIFLTMAGFIYLFAGGDSQNVERAKTAVKSAAIGYLLAAVSPDGPAWWDLGDRVSQTITDWFHSLVEAAIDSVFALIGNTVLSTPPERNGPSDPLALA